MTVLAMLRLSNPASPNTLQQTVVSCPTVWCGRYSGLSPRDRGDTELAFTWLEWQRTGRKECHTERSPLTRYPNGGKVVRDVVV
jgi:hypothetical protein